MNFLKIFVFIVFSAIALLRLPIEISNNYIFIISILTFFIIYATLIWIAWSEWKFNCYIKTKFPKVY